MRQMASHMSAMKHVGSEEKKERHPILSKPRNNDILPAVGTGESRTILQREFFLYWNLEERKKKRNAWNFLSSLDKLTFLSLSLRMVQNVSDTRMKFL